MKKHFRLATLIVLFQVFFVLTVTGQQKFTAIPVANASAISLASHFEHYNLFSINTEIINRFVTGKKNSIGFDFDLASLGNFSFVLEAADILSPDYKLVVSGPDGNQSFPRPDCMTFRGFLSGKAGSQVSLTITDDIIYGRIKMNDKEYFIEPLHYFDKNTDSDLFVIYEAADVKKDPSLRCGVTDMQTGHETITAKETSGVNCVQAQLAIASDLSMFTRYGSAAAVQTHNIGVMNNVIWDYVNNQFNDNIEFVIVTQNVSTSLANNQLIPVYSGTNANTILNNFRTWGEAGNFGAVYDIAQFWTTRNIDNDGAGGSSGIIGLAYQPGVCSSLKYHILEDYNGSNPTGSGFFLRVLASHEIGHNFNCVHDAANTPFIMAPSVTNVTQWSAASVAAVNGFIPGAVCLSACDLAGPPIADFLVNPLIACTNGVFQLTDRTLRGPSSWSWTLPGGTPSSTTLRNPSVSFSTPGMKTITLQATNNQGSSTMSKQVLVFPPPAPACSSPNASFSPGGVKYFSLGSIANVTGGAVADGNRYLDFSCTNVTSLTPATSYTVTVQVGDVANQVKNKICFFIDYNGDGDFADANEFVYTSAAICYSSFITFNIVTSTTPVFNQILRARIIAGDCDFDQSPCQQPQTGQVEDYGVVFYDQSLLPVKLLSFEGNRQNGGNYLNWKTTDEVNFDHFDIERSTDGIHFSKIGEVKAAGLNEGKQYNFSDAAFINNDLSKVFYRLKMVDVPGTYNYSNIVLISLQKSNELISYLYPNPFTQSFMAGIYLYTTENVTFKLADATGRIIYEQKRMLQAGRHTITCDPKIKMASGSYIFIITAGDRQVSRIVQKL